MSLTAMSAELKPQRVGSATQWFDLSKISRMLKGFTAHPHLGHFPVLLLSKSQILSQLGGRSRLPHQLIRIYGSRCQSFPFFSWRLIYEFRYFAKSWSSAFMHDFFPKMNSFISLRPDFLGIFWDNIVNAYLEPVILPFP